MPVYQRKHLRQRLGQEFLRDTLLGTTALSLGADATVVLLDRVHANVAWSGRQHFTDAWLLVASVQYRVASVNWPSGAFIAGQTAINPIASGADFEVHTLVSPAEKDRAIDRVVSAVRVREEVPIGTVDGQTAYAIDGAASPHRIVTVLDISYLADPSNSLDKRPRSFPKSSANVVTTATGREVRLAGALAASQQLILDALLEVTLGASDAATVNLPDDLLVLYGAEAACWEIVAKQPGTSSAVYRQNAQRAARKYQSLAARFGPAFDRPPKFDQPI